MKKVWIIAGLLIVIGGSAYLLFSKKGDSKTSDGASGDDTIDSGTGGGGTTSGGGAATGGSGGSGGTTTLSNFEKLKQNIGSNFTNLRDGSAIKVVFNNNKNFAYFYTNGRVAVFTKSNNKLFIKGSYADGGKKIILDNGKKIQSGSVWTNINNTIR